MKNETCIQFDIMGSMVMTIHHNNPTKHEISFLKAKGMVYKCMYKQTYILEVQSSSQL